MIPKNKQMKVYLLLFLNIIISHGYSQSKSSFSPKEYEFIQNEIRRLANSKIDSAFIVAFRLEKSADLEHKIFAKGTLAYLSQSKNDIQTSDQKRKEVMELSEKMPNSDKKHRSLAYFYNYIGLIDWQRGKLSNALFELNKGLECSKKINDIKQVIKLEMNISLINQQIGNYQLAIKSLKKAEKLIQENNFRFTENDFFTTKSSLFLNLGTNYEHTFKKNKNDIKVLDSALFYYKKGVPYSKYSISNKVSLQNNIAGVYLQLNKIEDGINTYQNVISECLENKLDLEFYVATYNLGHAYFLKGKYDTSLVYFTKVDSLHNSTANKYRSLEYVNSKYYQAKIYESKADYVKAAHFAKMYLENLETEEMKLINEKEKINGFQNDQILKKEMIEMQDKYKTQNLFRTIGLYLGIIIILALLYFLVKNYRHRKITEAKFNAIIEKYRKEEHLETESSTLRFNEEKQQENNQVGTLNLDEEKENQLLQKLKELEEKKVFLNQDFTLQFVAKKIKTNTTYLSHVVNKNFEKTFSEYTNELKINHVINEMITNSLYRKYSTQAIAESVGYKNANSFTRSFNKKTGLSPVQFAKKLEEKNIASQVSKFTRISGDN